MDTSHSIRLPKVAVLLERRREEIVTEWLEQVLALPSSQYQHVPLDELRASFQLGIGAIIEWFVTQSETALEVYLSSVSQQRLAMGFDIGEVIEALLLWKNVTLQVVREALPAGSAEAELAVDQVDQCLRHLISRFSHLYAAATQKHIRDQQIRTGLMYHVVQMASGSFDLDEILQRIAQAITSALDIHYCALYLADPQSRVLVPRVVTGERSTLQPDVFFDRCLDPKVDSLVAELLARREALVVQDVANDARLTRETADAIGIPTMLVVPSRSGDQIMGAIIVSPLDGHQGFDQSEINLVRGLANAVALIIENAQLSEQAEQLAVVNERQRLARELHDSVAQSLYSMMLYAEAGSESLKTGDQATVAEYLGEMKRTAQEALRDMRLMIFELRPVELEEKGLVAVLRERVYNVEARSGVQCDLRVEGHENIDARTAKELYRIAHEALNNVLYHAQAQTVQIDLCFEDDAVSLCIHDDGVGFDPQAPTGGMGLRGLRERVTQLGGVLKVESAVEQGTRISVTCSAFCPVPLHSNART